MTLIGKIVKGALSLTAKMTVDESSPGEKQQEQLRLLLGVAKGTAFGKYHGFASLLEESDITTAFRERVPIHDYQAINDMWWSRQRELPDITWPGKPDYFALTSGTTGSESKRIPVTDAFIQSMRNVGLSQLSALTEMDLPESVFSSEALIISSSGNLARHHQGHLEGEISGINVSNFPDWYDLFYRPGKEIAQIDDWDARTDAIANQAPEWNIGAIAGIPSWVQLCLQKVMDKHDLEYIDDLWPEAALFVSGGVAFETYDESFRRLFRKHLCVVDTYLASEGFFAYGNRANDLAMTLALSHGYYFEFVPFDERGFDRHGVMKQRPECLTIDQVREDEDYAIVVSTCAGAWRYVIGDTIAFTNAAEGRIRLTGRTRFFLNVVGSQLSEEKLDAAVRYVSGQASCQINEYSVACLQDNGEYYHQWVLVCDEKLPESDAANWMDEHLQKSNKNYKVARGKALKDVRVFHLTKDQYAGWLKENNKLGGQVKVQKVMPADAMSAYLDYITALNGQKGAASN